MSSFRYCGWLVGIAMIHGVLHADVPSFEVQVAPILLDNCVPCHGAKKAEGGYRLDTFEQFMKSGDSGDTPIVPGNGEKSEVYLRVISKDHSVRMPADSEPLAQKEVDLIRDWIVAGASFKGKSPSDPLYLTIPPVDYPPPPEKYRSPLPVTAVAFSSDGKQLFVSGYHELSVWNVDDGTRVARVSNLPERIYAIAVSPSGNQIAVGCGHPGKLGEVRLIDKETLKVSQIVGRAPDVVLDLAYSPDGNSLAIASADAMIRLIDIPTLQTTKTLASHADWVTAIAWSGDGKRLASASRDKSAKVYDVATGDLLGSYQGHAAPVRGVIFSGDGKHVISSGADSKWHRWEIENTKKVAEGNVGGEAFKVAKGEGEFFVASADQSVRRIELEKNKESFAYRGHQDWVLSVALHVPSNRIASGSQDGELRLWDLKEGKLIQSLKTSP